MSGGGRGGGGEGSRGGEEKGVGGADCFFGLEGLDSDDECMYVGEPDE